MAKSLRFTPLRKSCHTKYISRVAHPRIQVLFLSPQHAPAAARDCKHILSPSGARPADTIPTLLSRHPGRQPSTRHFPRPTSTTRLQSLRTRSTPHISNPPSHSPKRMQSAKTPRQAQTRMRGSCIPNCNNKHRGIPMMISVGLMM